MPKLDDFFIELDDPNAAPVETPPPEKKADKPEPKTLRERVAEKQPDIEALRRERDAKDAELVQERQRREEAERRAEEKSREATNLGYHVADARYQQIATGIAAVNGEIANAKRDYKAAMEALDHDKAAEAQEKIADATARRRVLEDGKAEMEEHFSRQQQRREARPEPEKKPDQPAPMTPEQWAGQFPGPVRDWLLENREYITDRAKNDEVIAYANAAAAKGLKMDDPRFMEFVKDKLGIEPEEESEGEVEAESEAAAEPEKPRARTMPAAPVSRDRKTFSSTNQSGTRVRLVPHLQKVAADMQMSNEAYAKFAVQAIKDGKLPKDFLDSNYNHSA